MQAELSDKKAAVAQTNSQLQEQQERYIALQDKGEAESNKAAAAAAMQTEQSEQLAQQLQAQLETAQSRGDGLQSAYDVQGKTIEELTAELSGSKAAAGKLQVSVVSHGFASAATVQSTKSAVCSCVTCTTHLASAYTAGATISCTYTKT